MESTATEQAGMRLPDEPGCSRIEVEQQSCSARCAARIALGRRAIEVAGELRLRVQGTSMLPVIWPGESVLIRKAEIDDLRIGACIAFPHHGHIVVHRLVGWTADSGEPRLIARGDACLHDDAPIRLGDLLGVVVAVQRFGSSRDIAHRSPLPARLLSGWLRRSQRSRNALGRLNAALLALPVPR